MSLQPDIMTLIISFVFGNLFTVLIISAYHFSAPRDKASSLFVVAKWLQLVFWCSMLMWTFVPHRLIIPLSNALILGGGGLEISALLLMMGKLGRGTKLYYLTLAVCSTISYLIIALFYNHSGLRIASASLWTMLFVLYPAYYLIADKEGSPLQKILGSLYYAFAAIMLGRAVVALVWEPAMNVFTSNLAQYLYYLGMYLLMIMGTAGFIVLSNEHSREELRRAAAYDELTGILSRGAFMLEARLKLGVAFKKKEYVSFLLLDIDHFKEVNDTYGHDVGDQVLKDFALIIESGLGNGDLFGRYGGEEFAVLLCGSDEASSERKAEELRLSVMHAENSCIPQQYSVSIGVVTVMPDSQTSLDGLYKLSDKALYQAKETGRNRVVLYHAAFSDGE